jgi:hypothetical protein
LAHLLHRVGPHHGGLHMGRRMALAGLAAREAGARIFGSAAGVSPQAGYSGEARAPKTIIQEGKKGIRGLMIAFMKIRAVMGFRERYCHGENWQISRYYWLNKVSGEIGLRRKAGLFRRKTCEQ